MPRWLAAHAHGGKKNKQIFTFAMNMKKHQERVEKPEWRKRWLQSQANAAKQLVDNETKLMKRQQIDTWAAVDDLGLTPHEFRLLYCIARHEKWKKKDSNRKLRENGCYASVEKLSEITGISRNTIFDILSILQKANIIEKKIEGDKPKGRAKKSKGVTFAGWTYEYHLLPITKWATPWELIEIRDSIKQKKEKT